MLTETRHAATETADSEFAQRILPFVSRTFAPAIDLLPEDLATPVRLSYLLCRVADTIEDASHLAPEIRGKFLQRYAGFLMQKDHDLPAIEAFAQEIACALNRESPEITLVHGLPRLMRLLHEAEPDQKAVIIRWTNELTLGMKRFVRLERTDSEWTALETCEDLASYEYYVAGTVGCLLHELFYQSIHGVQAPADDPMRRLAASFGLGLQGSNIIQDMADDRERGWSYIPEELARRHGTSTARLSLPSERLAALAVVHEMAFRALADLDRGFEYVVHLPRRQPRIRLFCLWPLLLAVRTLTLIVSESTVVLRRVRITRDEVRSLTRESTWRCLSNVALRGLYRRERMRFIEAAEAASRARSTT